MSVVIPVYNAEKTVAAAIDSVLAQSLRDFEVIAVGDGSKDSSREVLARYADRIRVIHQQNRGPSAARNAGAREASGEYLAFFDADDQWYPAMLARMVRALDDAPACVLAYCDLAIVDSAGSPLMTLLKVGLEGPALKDMLERMWPIMSSAVVMRRRVFDLTGGFDEAFRAASFEDTFFWMRAREYGPFKYVPEVLGQWRFSYFPGSLKPAGGLKAEERVFDRLMRERYGVSGWPHVQALRRAPRSILGYIGLRALSEGDRRTARRAFARALRFDPLRTRNYLRYLRTFLPARLANALSGRRGRGRR